MFRKEQYMTIHTHAYHQDGSMYSRPDDTQAVQQTAAQIWQLALAGLQTPTSTLPYIERVQQLFGHHNVQAVQAHLGTQANAGARAIQSRAYAVGNHIVFAGWPDLYTVAHEAAHVVQQYYGVHLVDGIGRDGDIYEKYANAVAERVIAGKSAQDLLDQWVAEQHTCSSNTATGQRKHALQRRLITDASEQALLVTASIPEIAVNLEALRSIVKRTIQILNNPDLTLLQRSVPNYAILLMGDVPNLLALTHQMKTLFPTIVYPGPQDSFALPRNATESTSHARRSTEARNALYYITNNTADSRGVLPSQHIQEVFGTTSPYGRAEVTPCFQAALAKLDTLVKGGRVFTDMSGALDEMKAGALTKWDGHIQMKRDFLNTNPGDDNEQIIGLAHEAFHATYADITDDGGYSQPVEPFKTSLAQVKFTNAAHYEEVVRRFLGVDPVGGVFTPEDAPGAAPRSNLQKAIGRASGRVQIAWERALNVHGFLVNHHFSPAPGDTRPLAYFSSLLGLTMHHRAITLPPGNNLTINDSDFVGVESVTRMLTIIKEKISVDLLTLPEQAGTVDVLTELLIHKALVAAGPITRDADRDVHVIRDLANANRNPQLVNLDPVGY